MMKMRKELENKILNGNVRNDAHKSFIDFSIDILMYFILKTKINLLENIFKQIELFH